MPPSKFLAANRIKLIVLLALPVIATMLTANLMGLIDTGMIGQLGDLGLASVSVGGNLFFVVFSLVMGMSAGVQILVARKKGAGNVEDAIVVLNGGIFVAIAISAIVLIISYLVLPFFIHFISDNGNVISGAHSYLTLVLPSLVFGGLSTAFGGFWLGMHKPLVNFLVIVIQLVCNAGFNYLFIFGNFGAPEMGVAGAGLGTTLANGVALVTNIIILLSSEYRQKFFRVLPSKEIRSALLKFSLPMGVQQFLFAVGMSVFVFIVGMLGVKSLAAFQVVITIMMTSFMLAMGLGTTATTFVSGALGKKEPDDAYQWGWEIATLGSGLLLFIGLIFFIFADEILSVFISDPETVALAYLPMRIMVISVWMEAFGRIISMALMGAGAINAVFLTTFLNQWFLRLPVYWFVGVYLDQGLVGIFVSLLVLQLFQAAIFINMWRRKKWQSLAT